MARRCPRSSRWLPPLLALLYGCGGVRPPSTARVPAVRVPAFRWLTAGPPDGRTAVGRRAVVATGSPYASRAAAEMIVRGGNAIDAAVAATFALFVADPPNASLAGRAQALVRLANGRVLGYDGASERPAAAQPDRRGGEPGYAFVPIGGNPALLARLAREHGRLPWRQLLAPAIALAEEGFVVGQRQASVWRRRRGRLLRSSSARRLFLHADGTPYRAGERLVQPLLARTLRRLADAGAADFYTGRIAAAMLADLRAHGSPIAAGDLRGYRVRSAPVLAADYHGHRVLTLGGRAAGAELLRMLQLLPTPAATAGTGAAGPSPVAVAGAICQTLAERRARLARGGPPAPTAESAPAAGDTSHLSVADGAGNLVALTTSVGPRFGAATAAAGLGFLYPFSYQWSRAPERGSRDYTRMTPAIVMRRGRPLMLLGAAGSERISSAVFQTIINVVDGRLALARAVDAPRLFCNRRRVWTHDDFSPDRRAGLANDFDVKRPIARDARWHLGIVQAVQIEADGTLRGAADPAYDGAAMGVP